MQDMRLEDFSSKIGQSFDVDAPARDITLILEQAEELPSAVRASGSFRLLFRGPHQPILPQATYTLRAQGASFDIFIVPLQPDATGAQYEAIFN